MLRSRLMQQWFTRSAAGMKKAFFDTAPHCAFAQLKQFARLRN